MIIKLLFNLLMLMLGVLSDIGIPSLPDEVLEYVSIAMEYIASGTGILANYVPFGYLLTLLGIIIAIDTGIHLYRFIMWILKKIPALNIK